MRLTLETTSASLQVEPIFVPHSVVLANPLTTGDECTRHETLAACYQLAQSVLRIGFALAKKVG